MRFTLHIKCIFRETKTFDKSSSISGLSPPQKIELMIGLRGQGRVEDDLETKVKSKVSDFGATSLDS